MTLGAVGATPPVAAPSNVLGLQDFLKILLTQLTYQDPLKPMDNQAFMAQMAQFTALEQSQQLNARVQQLIDDQAALHSVGLIGRTVEVVTEGGLQSGTVASLSLQGAAPVVSLILPGGSLLPDVALSRVVTVR